MPLASQGRPCALVTPTWRLLHQVHLPRSTTALENLGFFAYLIAGSRCASVSLALIRRTPDSSPPGLPNSAPVSPVVASVPAIVPAASTAIATAADTVGDNCCRPGYRCCSGNWAPDDAATASTSWSKWHISLLLRRRPQVRQGLLGLECVHWRQAGHPTCGLQKQTVPPRSSPTQAHRLSFLAPWQRPG